MNDEPLEDSQEEEGGLPFNLRELLLYGILRSKVWVVLGLSLGGGAGLVLAAAEPNLFTSKARLQYRPGVAESRTAEEEAGLGESSGRSPGIEDEILLINDLIVYERVAQELGPSWLLALPDPTLEDSEGTPAYARVMHGLQKWLLQKQGEGTRVRDDDPVALRAAGELVRERTRLDTGWGSSVILVECDAYSPEDARRITEAVTDAFVVRHNEYYSPDVQRTEARLQAEEENYRRIHQEFEQHKVTCGFLDLTQERSSMLESLNELRSLLDQAESDILRYEPKVAGMKTQLELMPEMLEEEIPPRMIRNPELAYLRNRLEKARERREELLYFNKPTDPQKAASLIQRTEESIASLEEQIEALEATAAVVPEGPPVIQKVHNLARESLLVHIAEDEALLDGARANKDILVGRIEQTENRLLAMEKCGAVHGDFSGDLEEQANVVRLLRQAVIEEENIALSREQGASALRLLSPADLPRRKSGPQRAKLLLMALFGGLGAGLAVAVLRQLLESRVRYPDSLESRLGVPLLAVVPDSRKLKQVQKAS